jgi:protein phosphatase
MTFNNSETVLIPVEPTTMQVTVDFGASTHPGRVRENNEDSYLVARASRSFEAVLTNLGPAEIPRCAGERVYGLAVADGMGGCAAGEVASHLALRAVVQHVLRTADWVMRDPDTHGDKIEERINERFAEASASISRQSTRNPLWSGMGTTMTIAVSTGNRLFIGHVGDSRAYLLRGDRLQPLTRDHSFAQTLADAGQIPQENVAAHHMRNILLRFLGDGPPNADVRHLALESGDQLLLCTDGLTDMVPEPQVSNILKANNGAQATCDQLVAAALEAGGRDNITVVLTKYSWKS